MPSWPAIARRIRVPLGFLFAAVYLGLARPTRWSILGGCSIAMVGLLLRAAASGHVRKNEQLTMSGPYAYTRNPLYLGSIVLAAGFVIAARSWVVGVIAAAMFSFIYFPVIRSEEQYLRAKFPEYEGYASNVPRLFPRLRPIKSSFGSFSLHLYWKHREYNAWIGSALMILALAAKTKWFER
jgi:protein-S-isoprenylcysteine O-methyltransferase Ste14